MTTFRPTSPAEDIAAWVSARQEGGHGLLTPDLVALVQSGVAILLGSCNQNGWPIVGSGIGCRVLKGSRLRVLCRLSGNRALLDRLAEGAPLAATFSAARDHRSVQVKTRSAEIRPVHSDDLPELDRQTSILRGELIELGLPPGVSGDFVSFDPADLMAVEFLAEQLFSQTPGPGAGAELK